MKLQIPIYLILILCTSNVIAAAHIAAPPTNNTTPASLTVPEWQAKIAKVKLTTQGCYHATYPSLNYIKQSCYAPDSQLKSRTRQQTNIKNRSTDGSGWHFRAANGARITRTIGTFPVAQNVQSVSNNQYSLQINTNGAALTRICGDKKYCSLWQQFVYESSEKHSSTLQMEYWIRGADVDPDNCPRGYESGGYKTCVSTISMGPFPAIPVTELKNITMLANAEKDGQDSVVLIYQQNALALAVDDSWGYISDDWTESEFNVFGIGGSLEEQFAKFNPGALFKVNVAANYQNPAQETMWPACIKGSLTGEGSNLIPSASCTSKARTALNDTYIEFSESVPN